jgi:hypothetical protein
MDGSLNGWMGDGWVDGWMGDGWMGGRIDLRRDGWFDKRTD